MKASRTMRILQMLALVSALTFADELKTDCVKFTQEVPKFTEQEKSLAEKYLPQLVELKPSAILNHYLSQIQKIKNGYVFRFSNLESIRSHECPDIISMVMDGSFSFTIDLKQGLVTWNPGESNEKPIQEKLK